MRILLVTAEPGTLKASRKGTTHNSFKLVAEIYVSKILAKSL